MIDLNASFRLDIGPDHHMTMIVLGGIGLDIMIGEPLAARADDADHAVSDSEDVADESEVPDIPSLVPNREGPDRR